MRVIEPHNIKTSRKAKYSKKPLFIMGLILVGIIGSGWWLLHRGHSEPQTSSVSSEKDQAAHKVAGVQDSGIKFFTGEQFQQLYENVMIGLPNTEAIDTPPSITGSELADMRIRQIAESRGYKLRRVPVLPIVKTGEPNLTEDDLLQPKAYEAWLKLKELAASDGIPLKLSSGYRSIDWQRRFFVARLQASGATIGQIINGEADPAIVSVLYAVAPPGYSRHHTGYTVDFICGQGGLSFKDTECFNWLKGNNYAKAKAVGLIPSYPEGVDDLGPEPEPWEYVWVSTANLTN